MKTYLAVAALALMAMVAGAWAAFEADQATYWRKQYDAVKPSQVLSTAKTEQCPPICWEISSTAATASTMTIGPTNPDLQKQLDEARAKAQKKINKIAAILKTKEQDEAFLLKAVCEHFRQEHDTVLAGCLPRRKSR